MSVQRKALLIISAICYAFVLYGFLFSELWVILIFFALHSICLIVFAVLSLSNPEMKEALEASEQEKQAISERSRQEITELTEKIGSLTSEKERFSDLATGAFAERDAAIAERDKALLEKEQDSQKSFGDFLPSGEDKTDMETIDILRIARDTVSELTPYAEKAKIQIQISSSEKNVWVRADAEKLHILFRNIIDNSIKYMNRAGSLIITVSNINNDLFIVLKDNGFGLPEEETSHIFELNYQGSNRISGNGLGLTQAKAIVEYYGGTIYAKSTPNNGMGIYVQLPAR